MKKQVLSMVIGLFIFLVIIGILVEFFKFDIAFRVDDTVYHDSDFNDINDDLYLHTLMFKKFKVMIPVVDNDNVCIIRDTSTEEIERIEVYRVADVVPPILITGIILYLILFFQKHKRK
jgi:hypothetical protein